MRVPYKVDYQLLDQRLRLAASKPDMVGLAVAVIRPFNTFGPRQSARAVLPTIITQIASGKNEIRLGNLKATRDFCYVKDTVAGFISLSGIFDLTGFLDGYYDQECYFNLPTHYLPNLTDPRYLDQFQRNGNYVLATGWDDQCLAQNQELGAILAAKEIPHQLHVWDATNTHSWPTWQQMAQRYL